MLFAHNKLLMVKTAHLWDTVWPTRVMRVGYTVTVKISTMEITNSYFSILSPLTNSTYYPYPGLD